MVCTAEAALILENIALSYYSPAKLMRNKVVHNTCVSFFTLNVVEMEDVAVPDNANSYFVIE